MTQRIALVTGGMGGLGEAICMKLARMGIRVVVTYSPGNTKYKDWLKDMADRDYTFFGYPCDVADFDSCQKMVDQVGKEVGPIDILINNAGITRDMTFKKMSKVDWDAVIHTNLDSVFNVTKPVVDGMVERGWGRIVNVSSVNGSKGAFGQTNYAAAKAGMIGFTKSLALEGASRNITANVVAPGYADTAMVQAVRPDVLEQILRSVPAGRLATPAEIARGVVFLVADEAGFINGITLSINGGKYLA